MDFAISDFQRQRDWEQFIGGELIASSALEQFSYRYLIKDIQMGKVGNRVIINLIFSWMLSLEDRINYCLEERDGFFCFELQSLQPIACWKYIRYEFQWRYADEVWILLPKNSLTFDPFLVQGFNEEEFYNQSVKYNKFRARWIFNSNNSASVSGYPH